MTWTDTFKDYPATTYTFVCALYSESGKVFQASGVASGNSWVFGLTSIQSSLLTFGYYTWTIFAFQGADRYTVEQGKTTVLPDLLNDLVQTHASKMVEIIEAYFQGNLETGLEKYNIDGKSIDKIPYIELMSIYNKYRVTVIAEKKKLRALQGQTPIGQNIQIYF